MTIKVSSTASAKKIAETIAKAFQPEPFSRWISYDKPYELNLQRFTKRVQQFIDAKAVILEANDHQAVAIFIPPWIEYPAPESVEGELRGQEVKARFAELGKKYPPPAGKKQWTLAFLAKHPDATQHGLISAILKPQLHEIRSQNSVCVLQATGDRPRQIYEHYGFRLLETLVFGKGEVNSETGLPDKHGEGVVAHWMVFNH